jgi:hypothetical protein
MIEIGGERYYVVVGETFVLATVPRENDPAMSAVRGIVEDICSAITAVMEIRAEKRLATQQVEV